METGLRPTRAHHRLARRLPVRLRSLTEESWLELRSWDISRGGMFVVSPRPLERGTPVEIEVELADGPLRLDAMVAQRVCAEQQTAEGKPAGMGLRFIELDPARAERLEQLLARGEGAPPAPERGADSGASGAAVRRQPAEPPPQVTAVLAELQPVLERLLDQDDAQRLGLRSGASSQEVAQAFRTLARRYHPDRFVRYQSEEVQRVAQEITLALSEAEERLQAAARPPRRPRGDGGRRRRAAPGRASPGRTALEALRQAARRSSTASARTVAAGEPPVATVQRPATGDTPAVATQKGASGSRDPEALLREGRRALRGGRHRDARNLLRSAARWLPDPAPARALSLVAQGQLELSAGHPDQALEALRQALELDSACSEARQLLRSLRDDGAPRSNGWFERLLGRD